MSALPLSLRLAVRELRAGLRGFRIFLACLTIGVAAIAAVGSLSASVVAGLRADGRELLGGDVELRLVQYPANGDQMAYLESRTARLSRVIEMRAMAGNGAGERQLAELKAVDDAYPLVGAVGLDPGMELGEALARRDGTWGAVVDRGLLDRLGLHLGNRVRIGDASFELRATIAHEPDRAASVMIFGPRLMIDARALPETGLVQPGSQIRYYYRALLPAGLATTAWTHALEKAFPTAGWRIRDTSKAALGVERFMERMSLFLTFVGLTALLVGGIGVSNAVSSYLEGKTATIATMKCVGARSSTIFAVYVTQIALLALVGIVIGVALGAALPVSALSLLAGRLPVPTVVGVFPGPLAVAALFGALTALAFALWPLIRARRIPASHLFRARLRTDRDPLDLRSIVLLTAAAAALAALTVATANDRTFALWFVGGTLAALLALRLGAAVVVAAARRVRRLPNARWRLGVGNLYRPGNRSTSVMLSLGLGLSVLVAVALIEGNLRRQITEQLPRQAPAFFFLDIQPHQIAAFDRTVRGVDGVTELEQAPSLRGRIVAIDGVPVEKASIDPDVMWAVRGDRALTYMARPADGTDIVAGQWWPPDYRGPPLISFDATLARGFGIGLGDTLTLNVLGREVEARIANLRQIDWRSLRFDFAIIFAPGTLEAAPHSYIAAVKVDPGAEDALQRAVTDRFANVTAIRVREALDAVKEILAGIGGAVRAAASVTLLAGALVLAGAVAAGHRRRVYDAVVFKVLGATRADVLKAYLIEYGLLGLTTGLIAAAVGTATAWAVIVFLMRGPWTFLPDVAAAVTLACIAVTVFGGLVGTWRALGHKAAPLLRNE
jgi:putative ABC transport system permease protein